VVVGGWAVNVSTLMIKSPEAFAAIARYCTSIIQTTDARHCQTDTHNSWLRGAVVGRPSLAGELSSCPALDLQLMGVHCCG